MLSAPSNSSWQLFRRILRKVAGFPSSSSDGNSGKALLSFRQSSAYIGQKVGSKTALSKISDITPCTKLFQYEI
jgi:hypothetical protein